MNDAMTKLTTARNCAADAKLFVGQVQAIPTGGDGALDRTAINLAGFHLAEAVTLLNRALPNKAPMSAAEGTK